MPSSTVWRRRVCANKERGTSWTPWVASWPARPRPLPDRDPVSGSPRQTPGELEPQFSDPGASATHWAEVERELHSAQAYWISTVRPDGRPHVTTIAAIWLDGALHFVTGERERKARNHERNAKCVVTTGCNGFEGLDVVVEDRKSVVEGRGVEL